MNHYYVTIPEGYIKYYAPSEQEVKRVFPEAISIESLNDDSHEYFVNRIRDNVKQEWGKGRWDVNTVFGRMEYWQFYDSDEPGKPLDLCKYRLATSIGYTFPVTWTLSTPEEFYSTFLSIPAVEPHGWTRIDYKEWAVVKKEGCYWRAKTKNEYVQFWINSKGEAYEVYNQPKTSKDLWKKFKDNSDTVCAEIAIHAGLSRRIYFANYAEFEDWADHNQSERVIRTKNALPPNPDLAKNVFRIPWYPIRQSPFDDYNTAKLWNSVIMQDKQFMQFTHGCEPYSLDILMSLVKEIRNDVI